LDRSRLEPLAFRSATSHLWQELFDITADSRDAAHPRVHSLQGYCAGELEGGSRTGAVGSSSARICWR
jgi:hypothetical protein